MSMKAVVLIATMVFLFGWYAVDVFVVPLSIAMLAAFLAYAVSNSVAKGPSKLKIAAALVVSVLFLIVSVTLSLRFPKDMDSVYLCRNFFDFLNVTFY